MYVDIVPGYAQWAGLNTDRNVLEVMWENEGRKTIIRNILIFLLLVAAAAGLLMAMITVKKQIDAEDELLQAESSNQRQELSVARQENLEAITQAYEKDTGAGPGAGYESGCACRGCRQPCRAYDQRNHNGSSA